MGRKHLTLQDVARAAGVSVSTASRALSGNPAISARTRARVRMLADEMGYRINTARRSWRATRPKVIGLAVPDFAHPHYGAMVTIIQRAASARGFATLIVSANEDPRALETHLQILVNQGVDGLIVAPLAGTEDVIEQIHALGVPIVLADRELDVAGITCVSSSPPAGMTAAVQHLKDLGHTPIGFLAGPDNSSTSRDRLRAFKRACKQAGLPAQPIHVGACSLEAGRAGTMELINIPVRAIIAGDALITAGALAACYDRGLEVGEDIALVGFDDFATFRLQSKPLSVIAQDLEIMARSALGLLEQMMSTEEQPAEQMAKRRIHIPTRFVVRESTNFHPFSGAKPLPADLSLGQPSAIYETP